MPRSRSTTSTLSLSRACSRRCWRKRSSGSTWSRRFSNSAWRCKLWPGASSLSGSPHEESKEMTPARTWVTCLLPAALGGAASLGCGGAASAPAAQPAGTVSAVVKTAPLQQQNLTDSLTAFGDVMTGQVVAISFPRAGQVSRLLVVPGQRVKPGTALATLVSDPNAKLAYSPAA